MGGLAVGTDAEALRRAETLSNVSCHCAALDEAQTQTWLLKPFDRQTYRKRSIIAGIFTLPKENGRIVTRLDNGQKNYSSLVSLACFVRYLRHLFSYRS